MKIYLNVPYSEKDTAKALGAKWDQLRIPANVTDDSGDRDRQRCCAI